MVLSQQETLEMIRPLLEKEGKEYEKYQRALIRKAAPGEIVVTVVGGKEETRNTAQEGDMVVHAMTHDGEEYILKESQFRKNYFADRPEDLPQDHELKDKGFKLYMPNRRCTAIEVSEALATRFGGSFMAAWGQEMVVSAGDFLASGNKSADGTIQEIIRIEQGAFIQTYREAK
ncbi:unnamed protein product [Symbiodinium natans]|uniref:Uncharacterized protein n=1 Tax=Symbiodinium natans TaxID=878477 RepID=A0A812IFB8_9DINO|nr:unnamed protein product [Symbiodinium natans]